MGPNIHSVSSNMLHGIKNENGIALIIVMGALLLLTILGVTMLSSSTSDLKISGNYRNSAEAFYNAEAYVQFAQTYSTIYMTLLPSATFPNNTWPLPGQGVILNSTSFAPGNPNQNTNNQNVNFANYNHIQLSNSDSADVKVTLVSSGAKLPAGTGTQEDSGLGPGTAFKANNFAVNVIAFGPNNSLAKIESGISRIVQQQ